MHEAKLGNIQSPLQVDLDKIADGIVEDLGVDYALLSVANNTRLVSLGLSASFGRSKEQRSHVPEDMVCLHTIKCDKPIVLSDARRHLDVGQSRYVKDGTVTGYLGVPIRSAEIGAIGAICGITSTPRNWSRADLRYLTAVAQTVENMILREMYRIESTDASELVCEYDQIIAAFSLVRAEATSIHDATGRLVFANRALTMLVTDAELESAPVRAKLVDTKMKSPTTVRIADGTSFAVTRTRTSSGYFVSQWDVSQGRLN